MQTVEEIRRQFPILEREVNRRPLVYLDNTATSQTPRCVVDAIVDGYVHHKANVHRGVHTLSQEATELQEKARHSAARFINAEFDEQIIFTRGTTEALNLVAASYGGSVLGPEDVLVLTVMEHHANIVPWQLLQKKNGFTIKVVDINDDGTLKLGQLQQYLDEGRVKIVSVTHASNVLGTVNPIPEIAKRTHAAGAVLVVDGAQGAPHIKIDVLGLGADFYALSSHKMYGPAGVGVLYGQRELLEAMPPYQGGGEMIKRVSFSGTTFADIPFKFEAGTPDFIDIAAFSVAVDWLENQGVESVAAHEHQLLQYCMERLAEVDGVKVYGTAPGKCAIVSFNLDGAHHYDVGMLLDKQGVAVRTGHHCAEPLMQRLGIEGCVRASFAAYNTRNEVDEFIKSLKRAAEILK